MERELEMKTVIVVPTYNERNNIEKFINAVNAQGVGVDILFVDDNSPDGTGAFAEELSKKCRNVKVLHRRRKEGTGKAYAAGFKWALENKYDYIMQMDADLSHSPEEIPNFLESIKDYDAVFGTRYKFGVTVRNWSFKRLLLSKLSNVFIKTMLRIDPTDTTTAFKCFRREVLEKVNPEKFKCRGNAFLIELVYWTIRYGFRTKEIQFMFTERKEGKSKMCAGIALESFLTVFRLALFNLFHRR